MIVDDPEDYFIQKIIIGKLGKVTFTFESVASKQENCVGISGPPKLIDDKKPPQVKVLVVQSLCKQAASLKEHELSYE
jgi:hypothetical protein